MHQSKTWFKYVENPSKFFGGFYPVIDELLQYGTHIDQRYICAIRRQGYEKSGFLMAKH